MSEWKVGSPGGLAIVCLFWAVILAPFWVRALRRRLKR